MLGKLGLGMILKHLFDTTSFSPHHTKLHFQDYKNTPKLTWLANTERSPFTPTVCVHFDHLITKGTKYTCVSEAPHYMYLL